MKTLKKIWECFYTPLKEKKISWIERERQIRNYHVEKEFNKI